MSVFLLILKIIGITLLSILAFVLLLLILVLLVPIRYRGQFGKTETLSASGSVSWLLRLFEIRFSYDENGVVPSLRIFWFFKKPIEKKTGEEKEKPEKEKEEKPEKEKKPFKERFEETKEKIGKALRLADNDRVRHAVTVVLDRLKRILKSILPKKLSGRAVLGLNGPYATARALSVLSVLMPIHKNAVEITPDFENSVVEAEIALKGRIILGAILFHALVLILNRDVIYTIRKTKKYFGKPKEAQKNG